MEILVFGAGAIGGYLGGKLALAGNRVTLVTRPVMTAAVNRDGLLISEKGTTRRAALAAVSDLAEAFSGDQSYGLIILGMKSYDLAQAVAQLATAYPAAPRIMGTQNGIGVEEIIAGRFGEERTVSGAVTIPISRASINHLMVEREGRGLGLAPVKGGGDVSGLVAMFRNAGVQAGALENYRSMKWSKAFLNIMGNASSAILNRPPAELYRNGEVFDLEMRMLHEALAVMARLGLAVTNLPGASARPLARSLTYLPRFLRRAVFTQVIVRGRGDKMPSFHIDLMGGKGRSEVIFHNGAIAAAGRDAGVPVPVNAALNDILAGLSVGKMEREMFDGRPDRLLAVVDQYDKGEVTE